MLLKRVPNTPGVQKVSLCLCFSLLYLRRVVNTPTPLGSHPSTSSITRNGCTYGDYTGFAGIHPVAVTSPVTRLVCAIPIYISVHHYQVLKIGSHLS